MNKIILLISIIALTLTACKKDPAIPIPSFLTIHFTHTVDGVPLDLTTNESELPYTNGAGQNYNVKTLQYLISNISLETNGSTKTLKDVHFVDGKDASTLTLDLGELQNGTYSTLKFNFGLNEEMNISNAYVNEDFHTTMAWPDMMGGGYHYMILEGTFNNETTFYNTHLGGTMGNDYSFQYNEKTETSFFIDDKNGDIDITINMDVNEWYNQPNTITLTTDGIMGNNDMQMQLKNNGSRVFSNFVVYE